MTMPTTLLLSHGVSDGWSTGACGDHMKTINT